MPPSTGKRSMAPATRPHHTGAQPESRHGKTVLDAFAEAEAERHFLIGRKPDHALTPKHLALDLRWRPWRGRCDGRRSARR